jgi:translation initiation factor eIF-2B subunit alpha
MSSETNNIIQQFKELTSNENKVADAVAAIQTLTSVLQKSTASTMMSLVHDIRSAADELSSCEEFKSSIQLKAGCALFLRYVTRMFGDGDFDACKKALIERGERFAEMSNESRRQIAKLGERFIRDGSTILTHGHSRCVTELLLSAAKSKTFNVLITEGRGVGESDGCGYKTAEILMKNGIPCKIILDSAIAFTMEQVDMCLVGADGVIENGGIVNKIGTYQLAIVAKALQKPLYVASETYKFARLYPLSQSDLPSSRYKTSIQPCTNLGNNLLNNNSKDNNINIDDSNNNNDKYNGNNVKKLLNLDNPTSDYTPPGFITLLFTDLGVLTTAAVSDELIKLYQDTEW